MDDDKSTLRVPPESFDSPWTTTFATPPTPPRGALLHLAPSAIAGLYAWSVTVAPVGFAKGESRWATAASGIAATSLFFLALFEHRHAHRRRTVALWVFVLTSAVTWLVGQATLARFDGTRTLLGMLGWALFALAAATPHEEEPAGPPRLVDTLDVRGQPFTRSWDLPVLAVGVLLAVLLQLVASSAVAVEHALLGRFASIAAALLVLGGAAQVAQARHDRRKRRHSRRPALFWLVALAFLIFAGLASELAGIAMLRP